MKEKDLEKCLDNLIIKGLIQEAEQDNAEFEAAMRYMSDEDFLALISEPAEVPATIDRLFEKDIMLSRENPVMMSSDIAFGASSVFEDDSTDDWDEWDDFDRPAPTSVPEKSETPRNGWKVWAAAIASVAAILLIVLIPAYREMETRLCESALLASATYMAPSRDGDDIATMPKEEVKALLPELKMQYSASLKREEGVEYMVTPENKETEYYYLISNPQEAGMELVQAYLRLNMKGDAVELLRQLSDKYGNSEFGYHCMKLLEILE